ncbi:MAG: hypothetical protein RR847_04110 [Bacilli bacterium]
MLIGGYTVINVIVISTMVITLPAIIISLLTTSGLIFTLPEVYQKFKQTNLAITDFNKFAENIANIDDKDENYSEDKDYSENKIITNNITKKDNIYTSTPRILDDSYVEQNLEKGKVLEKVKHK